MQQKLKFYIAPLTAKAQKSSDMFTKTKQKYIYSTIK